MAGSSEDEPWLFKYRVTNVGGGIGYNVTLQFGLAAGWNQPEFAKASSILPGQTEIITLEASPIFIEGVDRNPNPSPSYAGYSFVDPGGMTWSAAFFGQSYEISAPMLVDEED